MMDDEGRKRGGVSKPAWNPSSRWSLSGSCNRGHGRSLQFSSGNDPSHFWCIPDGKVQRKL